MYIFVDRLINDNLNLFGVLDTDDYIIEYYSYNDLYTLIKDFDFKILGFSTNDYIEVSNKNNVELYLLNNFRGTYNLLIYKENDIDYDCEIYEINEDDLDDLISYLNTVNIKLYAYKGRNSSKVCDYISNMFNNKSKIKLIYGVIIDGIQTGVSLDDSIYDDVNNIFDIGLCIGVIYTYLKVSDSFKNKIINDFSNSVVKVAFESNAFCFYILKKDFSLIFEVQNEVINRL